MYNNVSPLVVISHSSAIHGLGTAVSPLQRTGGTVDVDEVDDRRTLKLRTLPAKSKKLSIISNNDHSAVQRPHACHDPQAK